MRTATTELGLRERNKQRTRRLIVDTARRRFAERGFERVTVAEIAREADVAQATVFNSSPTKEDLFYSPLETFEERLLAAFRNRQAGQSVLAAFAAFLLDQRGVLAMDARRRGRGDSPTARRCWPRARGVRPLCAGTSRAARRGHRRRARRRRLERGRQTPCCAGRSSTMCGQ